MIVFDKKRKLKTKIEENLWAAQATKTECKNRKTARKIGQIQKTETSKAPLNNSIST